MLLSNYTTNQNISIHLEQYVFVRFTNICFLYTNIHLYYSEDFFLQKRPRSLRTRSIDIHTHVLEGEIGKHTRKSVVFVYNTNLK